MYAALITSPTGQAVSDPTTVAAVARALCPTAPQFEADDAEFGIWLVSVAQFIADSIEIDGVLEITAAGQTVTIETI